MKNDNSTIYVPNIDPDNNIAIASAIKTHLASFSQTQQPLQRDDLSAYLPSHEPPPECQPWEIYNVLKKMS